VTGISEIVAGAKGVTMGDDMTRAELAQHLKDFEDRVTVHFEETQSLVRLSLERLDMGRETTERALADLRREGHQLRALLESRLTHVSHRVDRLDRRS
jgi:hypothetical protein